MLYTIRKVPNKNCWKVMKGSIIHTKCSTLASARKQVKLLNQLDFRNYAHK